MGEGEARVSSIEDKREMGFVGQVRRCEIKKKGFGLRHCRISKVKEGAGLVGVAEIELTKRGSGYVNVESRKRV